MQKKYIFIVFFCFIINGKLLAQSGSLLVANKADSTVSIFNLTTKQLVALVPVGGGPHELAVSPDGKMAAVCNYGTKAGAGNTISVIDIVAKKNTKTISLGEYKRPHGIEFINNKEVIVTCEVNKALLRANIETGEVALVALTGQLVSHMVAYSPADKMAYVANINSGTVSVINVLENRLLKNIEYKKGIEGLAISPDGKALWVANREDSSVIVTNPSSGNQLAALAAHQIAYRVKVLPDGKYAMVSNGLSGNLSIYNAVEKKFVKDIHFNNANQGLNSITDLHNENDPPVPVGIATSTDSKYVFVALGRYNLVAVIDVTVWKIASLLTTGNNPDGLYYTPVYVK